jgi:hypothetical protein
MSERCPRWHSRSISAAYDPIKGKARERFGRLLKTVWRPALRDLGFTVRGQVLARRLRQPQHSRRADKVQRGVEANGRSLSALRHGRLSSSPVQDAAPQRRDDIVAGEEHGDRDSCRQAQEREQHDARGHVAHGRHPGQDRLQHLAKLRRMTSSTLQLVTNPSAAQPARGSGFTLSCQAPAVPSTSAQTGLLLRNLALVQRLVPS